MKIAITTPSFARYDTTPFDILNKKGVEYSLNEKNGALSEEETIQILHGCLGIIAGTEMLSQKVLATAPQLKVISTCGKSYENIDIAYAHKKNITILTTPKTYAVAAAEFTLGLILALLRQIPHQDRGIREGLWHKRIGNLLLGKRVGIIGFGSIGSTLATMLTPFGVEIAYADPNVNEQKYKKLPLDELMDWANIITLHCAKTEKMPLLDIGRLSFMRPGSYLINTARGGLVDEKALCGLLKAGHLAGAAIDTFTKEPYTGILKDIDNVILTPHISAYAKEARVMTEIEATNNIVSYLINDC